MSSESEIAAFTRAIGGFKLETPTLNGIRLNEDSHHNRLEKGWILQLSREILDLLLLFIDHSEASVVIIKLQTFIKLSVDRGLLGRFLRIYHRKAMMVQHLNLEIS